MRLFALRTHEAAMRRNGDTDYGVCPIFCPTPVVHRCPCQCGMAFVRRPRSDPNSRFLALESQVMSRCVLHALQLKEPWYHIIRGYW
jgi:hypothetical protein